MEDIHGLIAGNIKTTNYEEFLEIIKLINKDYGQLQKEGKFTHTYFKDTLTDWETVRGWKHKEEDAKELRHVLRTEWYIGGVSGGSCWDDGSENNHYSVVSDSSPEELTILDAILLKFCPSINFLEYKILTNKLVEYKTRSENEYYGNSSNYASYTVVVEDLFNYIKEKGWLA